jgi:hypothetical protein
LSAVNRQMLPFILLQVCCWKSAWLGSSNLRKSPANDGFCRQNMALRVSVAPCVAQNTGLNSSHHDRNTPASGGSSKSKYMR